MNSENFVKFSNACKVYRYGVDIIPNEIVGEHNEVAYQNVMDNLDRAHIFEISDVQKELLLLTDPSDDVEDLHLPFNSIFIDSEFVFNNMTVTGILARGGMLLESTTKEQVRPDLLLTICYNNGIKVGWETIAVDYKTKNFLKIKDGVLSEDIKNKIYKFFLSFLNFLNNPEVEYVTNDRSEKNMARRKQKGLPVISSSSRIVVTGKVKQYLDKIESEGHRDFENSFWVRGHHRRLVSPRYKIKKSIWIFPYIKAKGAGEIKEKIYEIK